MALCCGGWDKAGQEVTDENHETAPASRQTMTSPEIFFACGDCTRGFRAPQISRRRYCPECVTRRRRESGRKHQPRGVKVKVARRAERLARLERIKTERDRNAEVTPQNGAG